MQKILVVDDVQTDRELVGSVVVRAGHTPLYADGGLSAVEVAKTERPALILMDVVMPDQDGFKTTRDLKKDPDTSKIPIVLVTTKGTDSDRFWGKRQGADDHVVKPFSPDVLMRLIRRYAG
jgi:twitching motility two-component system response regulator PilH